MKKFNLVKGLSTAVVAMALAVSFVLPAKAAPAAPAITLTNTEKSGQITTSWHFTYPALTEGQELWFNVYSGDDPKKNNETGHWYKDDEGKEYYRANKTAEGGGWDPQDDTDTWLELDDSYWSNSDFKKPGQKTVVAYLYDNNVREAVWEAYWNQYYAIDDNETLTYEQKEAALAALAEPTEADWVSPASAPITIDVSWEASVAASVKSTSIQLSMDSKSWTSGYEVYRKVGKKYQKVATVSSDVYNDQGLLSKTEYSYKVRPYYKDEDLNKTVYGKYTQLERTTKGSALQLKLTVQKTKNVKLTWKKVPGAVKYEVWRSMGDSSKTEESKDQNDSYTAYKLIKTLGKNKKSYIDKKTYANETYSYYVRAILPADKKVKGDKDTYIEDGASVTFKFSRPSIYARYTDAKGNLTIQWKKGYGVDGYIVEQEDKATSKWVGIARLGKNATKYTFAAVATPQQDGTYDRATKYRIYAYKGTAISTDCWEYTTYATLGMVDKVTAKKVANGIQVSWTPVDGAAYYEVYRVKAGALTKNKDIGGYYNNYGKRVVEYVGASAPVAVDVAAWNAPIEAWEAADKPWEDYYNDETGTVAHPAGERPSTEGLPWYFNRWSKTHGKFDATKKVYYRNYQYTQYQFTGTSCLDYSGDIYGYDTATPIAWDANDNPTAWATYPVEVDPEEDYHVGPEEGVDYQYYVVAYAARQKTVADYQNYYDPQAEFDWESEIDIATPGTTTVTKGTQPLWIELGLETVGCKKITASTTFNTIKAPAKAKIKSLSSSKKTVTIKIKKVKGATGYKIYRSTKKKGKYMCVGTSKKVSFKDTGLEAGTTYYYKVVAIKTSPSGSDVEGKASAVKTIKAK